MMPESRIQTTSPTTSQTISQTGARPTVMLDGHDMVVTTFHLLSDGLAGTATTSRPARIDAVQSSLVVGPDRIARLAELCRRFDIRRVSLVGRAASSAFDPDHDVAKVRVEPGGDSESSPLDPDRTVDRWIDLGLAIESALGLSVELVTSDDPVRGEGVSRETVRPSTIRREASPVEEVELWRADSIDSGR